MSLTSGINIDNRTSTLNSSIQNLTSSNNYTFTGSWEKVLESGVIVTLFADKNINVLVQFSHDGTTIHSTIVKQTNLGGDGNYRLFTPLAKGNRYVRVVASSDSETTTSFSLLTSYQDHLIGSAPLNLKVGLTQDCIFTRSTFTWLDVARGLIIGLNSVKKFGRHSAVGTSFVPIALGGVYQTPQSSSATTLRIKAGGNTNNTAAGSGAREITLEGLDENFLQVTETIATNGASASLATTTTFTRLYRAYVSKSGTYATAIAGSHAGSITIENGVGGTDWATIDVTQFPKGQSEIGAYSIPAGKTGYVRLRNLSVDSGKTIDLIFFSRTNINQTSAPYDTMRAQSVVTGVAGGSIETFGQVDIPFGPYIGPTDVGFMGKVSSGTASVSVEFEIFLIDE